MTASRRVTRVAAPALAVGALVALEAIALVVLTVRAAPPDQRAPAAFAGTLALSLAAALYSWSYDHYLVVLLGAATLGLAARRQRGRAVLFLAVAVLFGPLAFVLFESAYVRWHDTLAGLVPVLAILGAGAAVSREASRTTVA